VRSSKKLARGGIHLVKGNTQQQHFHFYLGYRKSVKIMIWSAHKIRTREAGIAYSSNVFIFSKGRLIKEQAGLKPQKPSKTMLCVWHHTGSSWAPYIWLRVESNGVIFSKRQWAFGFRGNRNFLDQLNKFKFFKKCHIPQGKFISYLGTPNFPSRPHAVYRVWCFKLDSGASHIKRKDTDHYIATFNDALSNEHKVVNCVEWDIRGIF
jgi:hypothetical protein